MNIYDMIKALIKYGYDADMFVGSMKDADIIALYHYTFTN